MNHKFWFGAAVAVVLISGGMAPKAAEAGTISSWTNITNNGNTTVGSQLQAV